MRNWDAPYISRLQHNAQINSGKAQQTIQAKGMPTTSRKNYSGK